MKKRVVTIAAVTLVTGGQGVLANMFEVLGKIQGSSFLVIQAELSRRGGLEDDPIDVGRNDRGDVIVLPRSARARGAVVLDSIDARNARAIATAADVFKRHYNADLRDYNIEVVRDGNSIVVIFLDKDREPGTRGSTGGRPGFEVELDARDFRVIRSNFLR